jgi:hypothetical protein
LRRPIGRVGDQIPRLEAMPILGSIQHRLCGADFGLANGARGNEDSTQVSVSVSTPSYWRGST